METTQELQQSSSAEIRNRRFAYLMNTLVESDYFEEEQLKMREPLLYHMYVDRFQQPVNSRRNNPHKAVSKFLTYHLDKKEYEKVLEQAYCDYLDKNNKGFFDEQPDECAEYDDKGQPLVITEEELEDNVDELIRICHTKWLNGHDQAYDYTKIDQGHFLDGMQVQRNKSKQVKQGVMVTQIFYCICNYNQSKFRNFSENIVQILLFGTWIYFILKKSIQLDKPWEEVDVVKWKAQDDEDAYFDHISDDETQPRSSQFNTGVLDY